MKGTVFTEFMEMVEEHFSPDMLDQIIEEADLASGGSYTTVGTYDHAEMISLLERLSALTGCSTDLLLRDFGKYLFGKFHKHYPHFFKASETAYDFLSRIESHIHVDVLKLYPDAELPTFEIERFGDSEITMVYRSSRPFSSLAAGLIRGCIEHFREDHEIDEEDLSDGNGTNMRFVLRPVGPTL